MISIASCYSAIFAGSNYLASMLSAKERALSLAQRELDHARRHSLLGRLSGTTLAGRYDLGELLGRGGIGEVYEGRSIANGRKVAVKVLHLAHQQSDELRVRFRREAAAVAQLSKEHVAELIEYGTSEDGHDFLVMERLRGEDLGTRLRREESWATADVARLIARLAEALDAAHALGIVHRDVKPQNAFLVDGDVANVRLLDFGVARLVESEASPTMTSGVVGSAGYLAPEQALGDRASIGPATDVFALGAIAYRLLTGRAAFPAREIAAAVHEVLTMHPPAPSRIRAGLHADVDLVLKRALAKHPSDRYSRACEFASDLAASFDGRLAEASRARARALPDRAAEPTLTGTGTGTS